VYANYSKAYSKTYSKVPYYKRQRLKVNLNEFLN